jgi:pyridoxal phosphate enzyme (YggS family)
MTIAENLAQIEKDIEEYSTNQAKLLVVSKTHGPDKIKEVYDLGYRDFGENKVQELEEKMDLLPSDINWHLIGHLQRNKVKKVVSKVFLIHSVDSIRLLKEINKVAKNKNCVQDILLQFNISKEDTKSGFYEEDIDEILEVVKTLENINIKGLMTMAPNTDDEEYISSIFRKTKKIFDNLSKLSYNNINMEYISMGMTNDYILALKEGANIIRIGSKIFGKRMN